MANYIFKESIPKIAEFFYLLFIYFYPSFWTYYETWMRISTLKSQNWTFLAVFNLCIIIKILYDFWVRIKPKEPKPKKTVIYISVIPPPKFLSVSFCSIFIYYLLFEKCVWLFTSFGYSPGKKVEMYKEYHLRQEWLPINLRKWLM